MSEPKRIKPPPLKLGAFVTPPTDGSVRPSFYSEESTMITALSDIEREQLAKGGSPPRSSAPLTPPVVSPTNFPRGALGGPPRGQIQEAPSPQSSQSLDSFAQVAQSAPPVGGGPPQIAGVDHGLSEPQPQEAYSPQTSPDLEVQTEEHRVIDPSQSLPTSRALGNGIIVVFNIRGGVGASTLAVNIAGAAHNYDQRVALIDLDLQLGSLSSMLDGKPLERSLAELVMETSEADQPEITSAIDERAGLSLIAQDGRIGEIGLVTPDRLPKFLEAVRAQHDLVIIDGVRSFSDHAVTVMDIADTILLVTTQDVPALRSARKVLSLVRRLGYSREKVRLVLNRHYARSALSVEEIEDRLDYDIYEVLPSDFQFVSSLIEQGQLAREVDLKNQVTVGFDRLACRLLGLELPAPPSFFGKLFSKWSR